METLEKIKTLTEELSVDSTKFFNGNKSAGTRARQTAQELKDLLQENPQRFLVSNGELILLGLTISYIITYIIKN